MPKLKTHKGAKARIHITGTGKLMRRKRMSSHLRRKKPNKVTRKFAQKLSVTLLGLSLLKKVADDMKEDVRLEKPPTMEGRALSMILIPSLAATKVEKSETGETKTSETKVENLADAKT